jgi:hypothetical protein
VVVPSKPVVSLSEAMPPPQLPRWEAISGENGAPFRGSVLSLLATLKHPRWFGGYGQSDKPEIPLQTMLVAFQ